MKKVYDLSNSKMYQPNNIKFINLGSKDKAENMMSHNLGGTSVYSGYQKLVVQQPQMHMQTKGPVLEKSFGQYLKKMF